MSSFVLLCRRYSHTHFGPRITTRCLACDMRGGESTSLARLMGHVEAQNMVLCYQEELQEGRCARAYPCVSAQVNFGLGLIVSSRLIRSLQRVRSTDTLGTGRGEKLSRHKSRETTWPGVLYPVTRDIGAANTLEGIVSWNAPTVTRGHTHMVG